MSRGTGTSRGAGGLVAVAVMLASVAVVLPPTQAHAASYIKGIDVSHYQGTIKWGKVAGAGYSFVFAKATDGLTYDDPQYRINRRGARRHGIRFGAYHFAEPAGSSRRAAGRNARQQARHFLSYAAPAPGNLLPVLDLERNQDLYGHRPLGPHRLIHWTSVWLRTVKRRLGVKPLIYSGASTSGSFWATHMNDTTKFADRGYRLWIPHYTSASDTTVTADDWGGHGWTLWQWSNGSVPSAPKVPGISGPVDHDYYRLSSFKAIKIPYPTSATQPPAEQSPPEVSGSPAVGAGVSADHGTWANQPTSYRYSWRRCDQSGSNCTSLSGATFPNYVVRRGDYGHTLRVKVTAANSAGSATALSPPSAVVADDTPPSPPELTVGGGRYTRSSPFTITWSSTDDASGVAGYNVSYRQATTRNALGTSTRLASGTTDTSASFSGRPGRTYCFSARAIDRAGNRSARSTACTTLAVDDARLQAAPGWRRVADAPGYYRDTYSTATRTGTELMRRDVTVRRIALLAPRCSSCGAVEIRFRKHVVGRVDLSASRDRRSRFIRVAKFSSARHGTVKVVVTSSGRATKVDGLALSAR